MRLAAIGRQSDDGPTRALVVSGLPHHIHYQPKPSAVEVIAFSDRFGLPVQFQILIH